MADLKSYATVTASYWGFTITDGALRMLVLLHFNSLGYKPLDLAFLFLLYEAMGIVTNFLGGWVGARFGLRSTLFSGLLIQIFALIMLAMMPSTLTLGLSVIYVMSSQALSGIAKDLTKMSSKSAVKLVVPQDNSGLLFKWVSILTGSKNALKGVGFFVGGYLLYLVGFNGALYGMAGALSIVLALSAVNLKTDLGKAKKKIQKKDLFSKTPEVNYLSAARIFLFASRDVWFVVGVPVFLASVAGWDFDQVGGFMAIWVIGYGIVQAGVPKLLHRTRSSKKAASGAVIWGVVLAVTPAVIAFGLYSFEDQTSAQAFWGLGAVAFLILGLVIFGVVFAINSALHSYLIVAFSDSEKVSLTIGFYYMANAVGRLLGTLLSGLVYQYYGLIACLITSSLMVLLAVLLTLPLGHLGKQSEERSAGSGNSG
ncbi:MFS transporter [Pseudovibrio japonicus]|uniref:MFS transporter n=1 Tax=Pseudovibrio japonicus TaxID=366534 RepID=A0ABQ3EIR7_9HYPH|nr:organoarsenical effux MFS transporter ArsJ [Pseudovibrio japonicus]GHB36517.1 MFS transporter [Pseudovibrio japonicus]